MSALHDQIAVHATLVLACGGFVLGVLFGACVYATNFCVMGGISDLVLSNDGRRMRAWLLAIAVALVVTQALSATQVVALDRSLYLSPRLGWLGNLLGGGMLGFGMVFTGGCPSRCLARAGGGDLRALLVVMVVGIAGFAAIGGILGPVRAALDQVTAIDLTAWHGPAGVALSVTSQSIAELVGDVGGIGQGTAQALCTAAISGALVLACLADRGFRRSPSHIASGVGIGLLVAAGWGLTGLAYDDLAVAPMAPTSLTFVRPAGDALEWLQRATGLGWPGFGVATVLGTLVGAWASAMLRGTLRLATFSSPGETVAALGGAVLVGAGGVMAQGCTIGQGITGTSTLALGSYLTVAGIVAGCVAGLRVLDRWA